MSEALKKIRLFSPELDGCLVEAQFNPKEISFTKSVSYGNAAASTSVDGGSSDGGDTQSAEEDFPKAQFSAGNAIEIALELLFDEYENPSGDVRPKIANLMKFVHIHKEGFTDEDGKTQKRPPYVQLKWGGEEDVLFDGGFNGVVTSVETKYTMFRPSGIPCRAVATVKIRQTKEITISSSGDTQLKTQSFGSFKELQNANKDNWRDICIMNGISDPENDFPSGEDLVLP